MSRRAIVPAQQPQGWVRRDLDSNEHEHEHEHAGTDQAARHTPTLSTTSTAATATFSNPFSYRIQDGSTPPHTTRQQTSSEYSEADRRTVQGRKASRGAHCGFEEALLRGGGRVPPQDLDRTRHRASPPHLALQHDNDTGWCQLLTFTTDLLWRQADRQKARGASLQGKRVAVVGVGSGCGGTNLMVDGVHALALELIHHLAHHLILLHLHAPQPRHVNRSGAETRREGMMEAVP